MLKLVVFMMSIGSSVATAQSSFDRVCGDPELLESLPAYMKDNCAKFQKNKLTYTVTDDHRLVVKGSENGQPYVDTYEFPPGSSYSAQGRSVIIQRPDARGAQSSDGASSAR